MNPARLVLPALRWDDPRGVEAARDDALRAIEAGAGGVILFGGTAESVPRMVEQLRAGADWPLLVASDLERGAGQQVAGLTELPPPGALGWIDDPELSREAGRRTARDARAAGINWVLAPVADLDAEAGNPIVQSRAFGDDPERVAVHVRAWIEGCQESALACAKHYPGHGRTTADSHLTLPLVSASGALLERDRVPFRAAARAGVAGIMTAHVAYPSLDPTGTPATFSAPILSGLRDEGFGGVIVTDALMMEGARLSKGPGEAACRALAAGVDLLLYPEEPLAVIARLQAGVSEDEAFAMGVRESLMRWERAARTATASFAPGDEFPGLDRLLATRILAGGLIRGEEPRLRTPVDLVVVDDDQEGTWPPSSPHLVAEALERIGVPLGGGGSRLVLVFAEPRAGKRRATLGPRARASLGDALPGSDLVVLFGHRRIAGEIPGAGPVLVAWHRQRLMQESVADWIRDRIR